MGATAMAYAPYMIYFGLLGLVLVDAEIFSAVLFSAAWVWLLRGLVVLAVVAGLVGVFAHNSWARWLRLLLVAGYIPAVYGSFILLAL